MEGTCEVVQQFDNNVTLFGGNWNSSVCVKQLFSEASALTVGYFLRLST